MRYRVVEVAQRRLFRGQLRAADLERSLNEHAGNGWTLDRVVSAETRRLLFSKRNVFLLVLRRPE
jgi:hypothetical protein